MSERRFRIMGGPSVPWRMVTPYEQQALLNHDQSLERLNERGGLCPRELWCVVHGKRLRDRPSQEAADAWLKQWLEADMYECGRLIGIDVGRRIAESEAIAERDALRAEFTTFREQIGQLCDRLMRERDEVREDAAIEERRADALAQENGRLNAQLAAALAERDELRERLRSEFAAGAEYQRLWAEVTKERDEALARADAAEKREADGWMDSATEIEAQTVERIAQWVRSADASDAWIADTAYDELQYEAWLADQIRTFAWRKP